MKAELYKNTTRRDISLIDGFVIAPGEKRTVPWHVVAHPLTKAHVKLGELVVATPEAAAEAPAPEPEKPKPAASKEKRYSKRATKVLDKWADGDPADAEPEAPENDKPEG